MLDYEWGNPSTVMFTGNEDAAASANTVVAAAQDSDQAHRQIFDHYGLLPDHLITQAQHEHTPATAITNDFSLHHQFSPQETPQHHQHHQHQQQHIHNSLFDPRAFPGASGYPPPQQPPPSMLSLDPLPGAVNAGHGLLIVPKSEDVGRSVDFTNSRIGLNLGGRTYFSAEDDFVNRLYRRPRPVEPGLATSSNLPRCQAEGCNADLSHAKHYHRRHKVCEYHSKAATVIAAGLTQRFCQQCSRFHLLAEFDNGKRSCRKRLADHNRRRRKTQQPIQEIQKSQVDNNAPNSPLDNLTTSPHDCGAQSSSSVTVAVSPPDYFRHRSYQQSTSSSTTSSLFFSSG